MAMAPCRFPSGRADFCAIRGRNISKDSAWKKAMTAPGKFFPGNWRGVATGAQSIGPLSQIRRLPIQILTVIVGVMQSNMVFSNLIRPYLVDPLRKTLARWGIVFFRFSSGVEIPPTLVQYLQNLSSRGIEIDALYSFDDEAQIQRELLSIFSVDKVS